MEITIPLNLRERNKMRKIINGKVYDTDTAKYIARHRNSNITDFKYFEEDLYRKRTGEYFLWGEGGPKSRYFKWVSECNARMGGMKIIPLTREEARAWGEAHMSVEDYESEFGETTEVRL